MRRAFGVGVTAVAVGCLLLIGAAAGASAPVPGPAPAVGALPSTERPRFRPLAGPKIDLGHALEIELPEGFFFLDAAQAAEFMAGAGNLQNDDLLGLVATSEATWVLTIRFADDGYVKDDEAGHLDADAILKAIRDGTEEANKEREKQGFKALNVVGWSEPPHYAKDRHQMAWGIRGQSEGAPEVVNYSTRLLGRGGFASLNLIVAADRIEASKPVVAALLAATHYKRGARYEDFDGKKDHVASYGLAALVAGGAGAAALKLVKVGLLAKFGGKMIAVFLLIKKAIVVALVAGFAFLTRALRGSGGEDKRGKATSTPSGRRPPSAPG